MVERRGDQEPFRRGFGEGRDAGAQRPELADAGAAPQAARAKLGGERGGCTIQHAVAEMTRIAVGIDRDQRRLVRIEPGIEQIAEIDAVGKAHGATTTLPNTARSSSRLIAARPSFNGRMRSMTGTRRRAAASCSSCSRSPRVQLFEPRIFNSKVQM